MNSCKFQASATLLQISANLFECGISAKVAFNKMAVALVSAIVGEMFGKKLSCKIYYLLTLVLGVIAAARGLVFYVNVGENEVRIVDCGVIQEDVGLDDGESVASDGAECVKS